MSIRAVRVRSWVLRSAIWSAPPTAWLGAVGFAASARRPNARDAWMGWDDAQRCAHLHRVAGLCRFLIRPGVACRNLASHVLGRAARALREDFERLHGCRP